MKPGRRIGFDFGDVRIGVACSDQSGVLASPLEFLVNGEGNLEAKISELFAQYEPLYIAIGFPIHLSGKESEKSKSVTKFAELISTLTKAPIYLIDERMTTVSASRILREAGHNSKSARSEIDSAAAAAILDSALNQERLQGQPMNRFTP
ncbi:COG0816 Predicted endonuclease involved in recombination (possible Holliday junction resolvase in Mycoplasmas and B. subtilis) [actinobacterium SCGC AAA044-D11]